MKRLSFARKAVLFALLLAAAAVGAGLRMKDAFARRLIVDTLRAAGGFDVSIDRLHFGVLSPVVTIEGMNISNPTNFPVRDAIRIRRLRVRYDRWALLQRTGYIPEIDLELEKIVLVRMADGATNLGQLEQLGQPGAHEDGGAVSVASNIPAATTGTFPELATKAGKSHRLAIDQPLCVDQLRLRIDAMDYYDYALGGSEPMIIPAEIHFDQTFTNVTDIADVADQLQAKLDMGAMLGALGHKPPPVSEEQRKKSERDIDRQIERVVEGL